MRAYQIQDIRDFMNKLLLTDVFDGFLLSEASITTFASFHIDGVFHSEYFSKSENELPGSEQEGYASWRRIRPFFCDLVRGKHTPLQFRIVFRLAGHNVRKLLETSGIPLPPEHIGGLFLNIHYDGAKASCVSGTSLTVFSLDKSLEHAWDLMLEKFFRQKEIPFC